VSSPQDKHPSEPQPAPAIRPWSSLLIRDYRLIFITILCANTANHMRNVASLYQVYHLSGSSVQLGLAGFFQAFPFIIFGLFGGVLADTLNRKKLIAITHTLNILPGVALGILTLSCSTFWPRLYKYSADLPGRQSSPVSFPSRIFSTQ
jgi:MFS family permease